MTHRWTRFLVAPLLTVGAIAPQTALAQRSAPAQPYQARVSSPCQLQRQAAQPSTALAAAYAKARDAVLRLEDESGYGTGFYISSDGLALTAYHVVQDAVKLEAVNTAKARFPITVVGFDEVHDLALIQVAVKSAVPFLELEATTPKVGDALFAVGNSCNRFTEGRFGAVTGLDKTLSPAFPAGLMASSMPLAPGDSGGPVLNAAGKVVGVTDAIGLDEEGFSSYVAPLLASSPILLELKAGVKRGVPFIGIGLLELSEETVANINAGVPGILVLNVTAGSGAAKAGLRGSNAGQAQSVAAAHEAVLKADIITALDGKPVTDRDSLIGYLRSKAVGDKVELTVWRAGTVVKITVTLGSRPPAA